MMSWCWGAVPGWIGSLLTAGNQKGGGWHLYKGHGDRSVDMAKTMPPNDKSDGVDAFANVDKSQQFASIVLGGNSIGTVNVNVSGVPSWMGSSVNVKVEQVTWANKDTPVNGPSTLSSTKVAVTNGSFASAPVQVVPTGAVAAVGTSRLWSALVATTVVCTPTPPGVGSGELSRTR